MQSSGTDGVGQSWDNVTTRVYLELIQVNIEITRVYLELIQVNIEITQVYLELT